MDPDTGYHDATQAFNPEDINCWARNFAERLDGREKRIFYHRFGEKGVFSAIAAKLGYSSPAAAKYHCDRCEEKLRSFLIDLPWLSPDDLNEDAFLHFLDTLLLVLKESVPAP